MQGTDALGELDITVDPATDAFVGRGPPPLAAESAVPRFRCDLRVSRSVSAGLFEVSDPATGRSFTLYEFELALARMLDGRRCAGEVCASGVRLGVPVDLPSLEKFVRQLWHYGFLSAPGAPEGDGAPAIRAEHEMWDEATRALFQTGERLLRAGRGGDAAAYFEAVLDAHPASAEASEMLALAARGQPLPVPPPTGRAPRARARWTSRVVAAGVLLAAAGAALLLLRAPPPDAPRAAAAPPVEPAPLASLRPPAPPPQRPAWRSGLVARRVHPLRAEIVSPATGTVSWRSGRDAPVRAGERIGEVRTSATRAAPSPALARRVAELEVLASQDPVYRDFLDKARREQRRASRGAARRVSLVAPASGLLVLAGAAPRAVEGEVLGHVADPASWHVDAEVEGEPPDPGSACEVHGVDPAERAPCRVLAASPGGGRSLVTAEVSSAAAPWLASPRPARVRVAPAGTPLDRADPEP